MRNAALIIAMLLGSFVFAQAQEKRADYYENGKKKWEGHILNGQKMGEWVFYFDNGQKEREGIYKDGKPYGEWVSYWRSGQVKSEGNYIVHSGKAVQHGEWTYYHKNGAQQAQGRYQAGKKVGLWYEYNTLGIEIKKTKY